MRLEILIHILAIGLPEQIVIKMDISIYNGRTKLYAFLSGMGKEETFEVIGISFKVYDLVLNPMWRHFKSNSNLNTIFSLQQLERKPEIHGLENYSVFLEQGEINIVRKENGVMITDRSWKKHMFYQQIYLR